MIVPLKDIFSDIRGYLQGTPIYALETGCSFAWSPENMDNLSTPNIVEHLCIPTGGKLYSVDNDESNIEICKNSLELFDYNKYVEFYLSDSLDAMIDFQYKGYSFNFFWLDSCEDINHGFGEYNLSKNLIRNGQPYVICIDDYGANGSVKWRKSSEELMKEAKNYSIVKTGTGLIVGYF